MNHKKLNSIATSERTKDAQKFQYNVSLSTAQLNSLFTSDGSLKLCEDVTKVSKVTSNMEELIRQLVGRPGVRTSVRQARRRKTFRLEKLVERC